MEITVLLDRDLDGEDKYFEAGMKETGWDRLLTISFKRFRDFAIPDNETDREVWRFVQHQGFLLITNNRNRDDDTSLQATMERENTPESLPIITISRKEDLKQSEYRQEVITRLADIIIYLDDYRGAGRLFAP